MKWKSIELSENLIKHRTEKSYLIEFPKGTEHDGWVFWHPSKLIKSYRFETTLSYTDDFVFRLKKYGAGRSNSGKIIDEREASADEVIEALSRKECISEVYIPPDLDAEKVEALEELKDDLI